MHDFYQCCLKKYKFILAMIAISTLGFYSLSYMLSSKYESRAIYVQTSVDNVPLMGLGTLLKVLRYDAYNLPFCEKDMKCERELFNYIRISYLDDSIIQIQSYDKNSNRSLATIKEVLALISKLDSTLLDSRHDANKVRLNSAIQFIKSSSAMFKIEDNFNELLPLYQGGRILKEATLLREKDNNRILLTMIGFLFGILLSISVVFLRGCDED